MTLFRNFMCLALIAVIAGAGVADEKEKKGKRRRVQKEPSATQRFVGKMELSAEQKEKVAAIDKQFAVRTKALAGKKKDLLTEEQQQAQSAAQKAAREAGRKGAEMRKSVREAVKLTDDQKVKQKELFGLQRKLNSEVLAALKKVLTEEQQAKLPAGRRKAQDGRKKGRSKQQKAAE